MLPIAMRGGISFNDFWDMTLGELVSYLNIFKDEKEAEQESQVYLSYQTALLTARFVNDCLNGNQPQTFFELFPNYAHEEISEQIEEQRMNMMKNQWLVYAQEHNNNRKKEGL